MAGLVRGKLGNQRTGADPHMRGAAQRARDGEHQHRVAEHVDAGGVLDAGRGLWNAITGNESKPKGSGGSQPFQPPIGIPQAMKATAGEGASVSGGGGEAAGLAAGAAV